MSTSQDRLKLTAKRSKKTSDPNQNYKNVNSKNDRNINVRGLKRRLSSESDISNKKTFQQTKTEISGSSKNLAKNRLALLRENLNREQQTTSKHDTKKLSQKTSYNTSQNVPNSTKNDIRSTGYRIPIKKSTNACLNIPKESYSTSVMVEQKVVEKTRSPEKNRYDLKWSSEDVKLHKSPLEKLSFVESTSDLKAESRNVNTTSPKSEFDSSSRIPIKKSANERLNIPKESYSTSVMVEQRAIEKTKSPEKNRYYLKRSSEDVKLHRSPLKKSSFGESTFDLKTESGSVNTTSPKSGSDSSFRLSKEFIIVSEASDSEDSSKTLTPISQRLIKIRNSPKSSGSSRTLTPSSDKKSKEEACFKTPLRPSKVSSDLKIPLNRSLFKNRVETTVQSESSISRSKNLTTKEQLKDCTEYSKSIFGSQVPHNIFRNYSATANQSNNFASNNRQNINSDVILVTTANTVPTAASVATTCQNNLYHNSNSNKSASSTNIFSTAHQPGYPSGPKEKEDSEDEVFAPKYTQNSKNSVTNRLARIRSEGCNTYRKNQAGLIHENVREGQIFCLEDKRSRENLVESRLGPVTNAVSGFNDSSDIFRSPSKCHMCSKEFLTENWLQNHQCTNKAIDTDMSDSMVVNVDDTILNKSELPDPLEDVSMDWDSVPQETDIPQSASSAPPETIKKENVICIVTDTNVFMHYLHKIKDAMNLKLTGKQKVKIYIPWMVLKELDHLKDHSGEPTKSTALAAQKFINRCLVQPDSKLIGQSVTEVSQQQDIGKCPDDKILACCMQVDEKYDHVVLLTNDTNLRNKALVNSIETCTPQEILGRLNRMMSKRVKFCEIRSKLVSLWSSIICDCCKEAYGDAWKKMDMLQNPPWSMVECTKRFQKYWGSVFRQVLLKQCKKTIDEFHTFLMAHKDDIVDDSEQFNDFMKQAVEFLVFLRDLPSHKTSIKKTLNEMIEIASSS